MKITKSLFFIFLLSIFAINHHGCAPRKTKSVIDRVYELDPSGRLYIHPRFKDNPPEYLAVLPFLSHVGEGRAMWSQSLLLSIRGKEEAAADELAQQMRLAFFGQLAQRSVKLIPPYQVDDKLRAKGLLSWDALKSVTPGKLKDLLGVDGVIFGEVIHFDYYYGFLYTQRAAGLRLEMISTLTGELLWRFNDTRRDHTVRIALDPVSLAVGLFQAGFSMRPINMTRAMDEISREAVATLPYR